MKEKPPAFQFYPDDWMGDINVISMSPAEEGHYIRLCAICWKAGAIPSDPDKVQGLLKSHCESLENILKCFYKNPKNNSQLLHKRLEKERKKQKKYKKDKSKAGKKGAASRWKNNGLDTSKNSENRDGSAIVLPLANDSSLSLSLSLDSVSNSKPNNTHTHERVNWFKEDWGIYPRQEGDENKAKASYLKTITNPEERNAMLRKMKDYVESVEDHKYLKHAETFFRTWKSLSVPRPRGYRSNMEQAEDSRGEFVDQITDQANQIQQENPEWTREAVAHSVLSVVKKEDEKLATAIVLYNYSYTENDPRI